MKKTGMLWGLVLTLLLAATSCTRIDIGHAGVLVNQYGTDKGASDVVLVSGRVWYNPLTQDVEQYATFVQTIDYEPFTVNAKDGSEFVVDPTLSYNLRSEATRDVYIKYRKDIKAISRGPVLNYVKDAFRLQMNKYTTDEIVSNREKFENDVQATLSNVLDAEGFRLEQLTSGLKYPQTIVDAVNAKNKAVQEAMRAENEMKIVEVNVKKRLMEAEAEKQANLLKQKALTPELLQQQFIEKWDGKTPLYGTLPTFFKTVR